MIFSYILGGLNSAFMPFITSFNLSTRDSIMTFEDFQAELLNYKVLLGNYQQAPPSFESGNFALYTHKPKPASSNYHKGKSAGHQKVHYQPNQRRTEFHHQPNQRRTDGNFYSKNHFNNATNSVSHNRAPCQICGKSGDQALDCFHRMNSSYPGRHPPSHLTAMVARAQLPTAEPQ
jgi:hypothetical protein